MKNINLKYFYEIMNELFSKPARQLSSWVLLLGTCLCIHLPAHAENLVADPLASQNARFESADGARVLQNTASHLRRVFEIYVPAVDSNSEIVSPKVVTGTSQMPHLDLGIRACVFVICRTIQLNSEVSIQPTQGRCQQNLLLTADLSHSTDLLANHFDALNVNICLNPARDQQGHGSGAGIYQLTLEASAHHASNYSAGPIASNALRFLKLQTHPVLEALNRTLVEDGAQNLVVLP